MSNEVLKLIKKAMGAMELCYGFMEYVTGAGEPLPRTYFVGEYQELEGEKESGEEDSIFILTGFSREGWGTLEQAKGKVKKYFPDSTGRVEGTGDGAVAAVFYENSFPVPLEDEELKKIQINLKIKEWKVEA